jgi:hypothetical protein
LVAARQSANLKSRMVSSENSAKKLQFNVPVVLLLIAVVFVAVARIRLLTTPLERDEGEFAYGGQLLLQGIPPYKLFYAMKFPGIYAAYALIMAVFGQSPAGIHFGLLLINLACIGLLYRVARHFLDVPGAAAAAASYAFLSTSPLVMGLEAHATHFVVLAALAGLLLLLHGQKTGKFPLFFFSGFCLGISCLMKQPGIFFGLFALGTVAANVVPEQFKRIGWFCLGMASPLVLAGLILWQAGVFAQFWFWTVEYARVHGSELGWSTGWDNLRAFFHRTPTSADGLFWMAGAVGLCSLLAVKGETAKKLWMIWFLVFSAVAVSLSNYFSFHYFVMLLSALCLMIGQAVQWIGSWSAFSGALVVIMWGFGIFFFRAAFFVITPDQFSKDLYGSNPFVECRDVARYIGEHSSPTDSIAVLGSEPEIPFYAHRRSATSYIYMYDLMEAPEPYATRMQTEMIQQIEAARPEFLVFVKTRTSWSSMSGSLSGKGKAVLGWSSKYISQNYDPVGLVNLGETNSEYYWDKAAADEKPSREFIGVFKRK